MQLEYSFNEEHDGIELHFKEEPSAKQKAHLKESGFKEGFHQPLKWWAKRHPAFVTFAEELKKTLLKGDPFTSVLIQPSFYPSQENIDHNKFSYVTITYLKDGVPEQESYVIFDPWKVVAKAVATRYGKEKYGSSFKEVDVTPRKMKIKARELLEKGKVITGEPAPFKETGSDQPERNSEPLANEHGVYTEALAGKNLEKINIPIPKAAKFNASISIAKGTDGLYRYGITIDSKWEGISGQTFAPGVNSQTFADRQQALKAALDRIAGSTLNNDKAYQAIEKFAGEQGIELYKAEPTRRPVSKPQERNKGTGLKIIEKSQEVSPLYHGTCLPFERFDKQFLGLKTGDIPSHLGYHFTPNKKLAASIFANDPHNDSYEHCRYIEVGIKVNKTLKTTEETLVKGILHWGIQEGIITERKDELWELMQLPYVANERKERSLTGTLNSDEWYNNGHPVIDYEALATRYLNEVLIPQGFDSIYYRNDIEWPEENRYDWIVFDESQITYRKVEYVGKTPDEHEIRNEAWQFTKEETERLLNEDRQTSETRIRLVNSWTFHNKETGFNELKPDTPLAARIAEGEILVRGELSSKSHKQAVREALEEGKPVSQEVLADYPELNSGEEKPEGLREQLIELGFSGLFTAQEAFDNPLKVIDLQSRWNDAQAHFKEHIEKPAVEQIQRWETVLEALKGLKDKDSKEQRKELKEKIANASGQVAQIWAMMENEYAQFHQEMVERVVDQARQTGHSFPGKEQVSEFSSIVSEGLFDERMIEPYYKQPIPEIASQIIQDFFKKNMPEKKNGANGVEKNITGHPILDVDDAWTMTPLEYQQMKAIEKTGSSMVLNAQDRRNHEAIVKQAIEDGQPVPQRVLDHYPWLIEEPPAQSNTNPKYDYIDRVVAHMHDRYASGERPTKSQIEQLAGKLSVPNLGMLWEAVELSWMLWYRQIYREPLPFEERLHKMVHFWHEQQPTYAYSDSSKELYKQYSTPCPIGAMVAQYTGMDNARRIFEPSAGNGLLLVGADPGKTHVNEIDPTRLASLKFQGFHKITNYNAIQPFPDEMTKAYDVVVTNPPFARWEEAKFDKELIIRKYFSNHVGLAGNIRLEHLMAGLALHTMKDTGKAAIIIMGHVYFAHDGFIAKYRPFFNWLFRHYQVDDVINMNSFKLYNKQGAIEKTMLILVGGRKAKPQGVAPQRHEAPYLYDMVNSFDELWNRIKPHLGYNINTIINQLQIELQA